MGWRFFLILSFDLLACGETVTALGQVDYTSDPTLTMMTRDAGSAQRSRDAGLTVADAGQRRVEPLKLTLIFPEKTTIVGRDQVEFLGNGNFFEAILRIRGKVNQPQAEVVIHGRDSGGLERNFIPVTVAADGNFEHAALMREAVWDDFAIEARDLDTDSMARVQFDVALDLSGPRQTQIITADRETRVMRREITLVLAAYDNFPGGMRASVSEVATSEGRCPLPDHERGGIMVTPGPPERPWDRAPDTYTITVPFTLRDEPGPHRLGADFVDWVGNHSLNGCVTLDLEYVP